MGVLKEVLPRGFGFAQPLTGESRDDIFLNETRLAALGAAQERRPQALLLLGVIEKGDGKRSALRARPLDLRDARAASLLWDQVLRGGSRRLDVERLRTLVPSLPVALPLLFVLLDERPGDMDLLDPIVSLMPGSIWHEPALRPILHLAPSAARGDVFLDALRNDPEAALSLLVDWNAKRRLLVKAAWLETLWRQLPARCATLVELAQNTGPSGEPEERLQWARRGIDLGVGDRATWWERIANAVSELAAAPASRKNAPDAAMDDWKPLAVAPSSVVRALLRRWYPDIAAALQTLESVASWSREQAAIRADALLKDLDAQDRELAEKWVPSRALGENTELPVRAQMLTARAAEKWASRYLQSLGLGVRDVSIEQLQPSLKEWVAMDLQVDGRHGVDVKNCRRTVNGGMRSGRWKVKTFKADAAGRKVTLCGVSSPHTRCDDDGTLSVSSRDSRVEDMVVLGVTHAAEVEQLLRSFRDVFDAHTPACTTLKEMPAWAWDYPAAHYRKRNDALIALRAAAGDGVSVLARRWHRELPPLLWSIWNVESPGFAQLDDQQRAFLRDLGEAWRKTQTGDAVPSSVPRLPWLYLFTLHAWLRWRRSGRPSDAGRLKALFMSCPEPTAETDEPFEELHEAVDEDEQDGEVTEGPYLSTRTGGAPLAAGIGIADPAHTLDHLLDALGVLDQHLSAAEFQRIERFTFHPNGVLTGTYGDGKRRTLLAHCGGTLEKRMVEVECGHWPLTFGRNETCACGRLICPMCSCCTASGQPTCPHEVDRKERAREALSRLTSPRTWRRRSSRS
ncbi:hypothetical protein OV207_32435 [Corallococcus sp. BB11-1]|uniref:hypothetical protein n=1 Tax=Corallococcus sp. BB11-1 TaxID=2996783 RepID=UPI0022711FCF|nr:hypothetical protein [Corallococcus sp. BB11-1]MCY1036188.1 hypothetical protein [Corallococcus sp. BB11-1]